MLDYELLKIIWWVLIGVLLIGLAITDGADMGVGALLPILGRTDEQRRVMLNTVGPHWEGNQVWLITAGGAIFAAWPQVYATAFSGFYFAMLLVLAALFFRPVGFDYRSKIENKTWRTVWDWGLFIGGLVPALIFGVAFGNLLLGVPFTIDEFLRPTYQGSFWGLLNPFALLAGLVSVAMLMTQGSSWLTMKTKGELLKNARRATIIGSLATSFLFTLAGIMILFVIDGYTITQMGDHGGPANPLLKTVTIDSSAWLNHYKQCMEAVFAPLLGLVMPLLTAYASMKRLDWLSFFSSSVTCAAIILTAGFSLFPFIMPSSLQPNHSLTVWDATSSELTLNIMFWVAVVFVPIILAYTIWCYMKMYGRIDEQFIRSNQHSTY